MSPRLLAPESRARSVLVGLAVAIFAVVLGSLSIIPAAVLDPTLLTDPTQASMLATATWLALNFVGIALGGVIYLRVTDRGWDWIDVGLPGLRDVGWMVGGLAALFGFYLLVGIATVVLDLPAADSDLVLLLRDDVEMILLMIAVVWLLNAPAEEFVFRNVIQKRLYTAFSGLGAVVVASLLFVMIHIPMYLTLAESALATGVSLLVMFGGSLIFGYLYLRTENLVVPTVVHAAINTIVISQLLIQALM